MNGMEVRNPRRIHRRSVALAAAMSVFAACEVINPEEPLPVYTRVDSIPFSITSANQGSGTSSIVDAWVYLDDQLVGAFELPARFPVLAEEGTHTLTVSPGILVNGIKSRSEEHTSEL